MLNSKIEWCDHTVNLWWGCTEVHEGCDNCYAKLIAKRYGHDVWGVGSGRRYIKSAFETLDKIQKNAEKQKKIEYVFVGSMMDIFEKPMPIVDNTGVVSGLNTIDLRNELFRRIDENQYSNLVFLFLTKRPSNINKYIPLSWVENPPLNVFFGLSVVNQKTANDLIPKLLKVNGQKFLSVEPQLESLSLEEWLPTGELDWIIQGGESGGRKRPFDINWGRQLRNECLEHHVPYFFKQIDKVQEIPEDLLIRQFPL